MVVRRFSSDYGTLWAPLNGCWAPEFFAGMDQNASGFQSLKPSRTTRVGNCGHLHRGGVDVQLLGNPPVSVAVGQTVDCLTMELAATAACVAAGAEAGANPLAEFAIACVVAVKKAFSACDKLSCCT